LSMENDAHEIRRCRRVCVRSPHQGHNPKHQNPGNQYRPQVLPLHPRTDRHSRSANVIVPDAEHLKGHRPDFQQFSAPGVGDPMSVEGSAVAEDLASTRTSY
jgi:hypothetical protein